MLISRGCPWASMKRGGCKFGGNKTGAVNCQKKREGGGAVVSQLVPKLKESAPPPHQGLRLAKKLPNVKVDVGGGGGALGCFCLYLR